MILKFRDRNGNVWKDIQCCVTEFCGGRRCDDCPIYHAAKPLYCKIWIEQNPIEAARLSGSEVIGEEDDVELC